MASQGEGPGQARLRGVCVCGRGQGKKGCGNSLRNCCF